ncbi:hypothetical protein IV203_000034 [Nitzschia inconspicua]|uniref:Uncharacterized protein n=1 Tax=Nitzschia inconspicua TaxID=303405 RepID=A0A9K3PQ85_9STRA|nr:hypothetical protein IV203_000034 [Nitzschia inconspicua]
MERQFLLEMSFFSAKRFEETYLGLCDATIKMYRRAKRRRMAAILQAEVAEYYVRQGILLSLMPFFSLATDTKTNKGVNTPWGGTSSTAIVTVSDPAEWPTGPFCHVYIATCESLDQCLTKVKPVLQAFLSQIESAASNTAANQQRQQGGHTADYLIVYVPINGGASTADKLHQGFQSIARWRQCFSTRTLPTVSEGLDC